MIRYSVGIVAALLLTVSPASAQVSNQADVDAILFGAGNSGTIVQYRQYEHISHEIGTYSVNSAFSAKFDTRPTLVNSTWILSITASKSNAQTANGVWNYQVTVNEQPVPDCFFRHQTINAGTLGGNQLSYAHYAVSCTMPAPPFGPATAGITRSVFSGSPASITHSVTAISIDRIDFVVTDMPTTFEAVTGLTAAEFLIFPALAIIGLFVWTRKDLAIRLFGIFLVIFDLALVYAFYARSSGQAWPGLFVMVFVLLLAASWMVIQLARDIGKERRGVV